MDLRLRAADYSVSKICFWPGFWTQHRIPFAASTLMGIMYVDFVQMFHYRGYRRGNQRSWVADRVLESETQPAVNPSCQPAAR
jgi:hypothetical protein